MISKLILSFLWHKKQFYDWCLAMLDSAKGTFTLYNLCYDCHHDRIHLKYILQYYFDIARSWRMRTSPCIPEDIHRTVIDNDPSFYLFNGSHIATAGISCSRIVSGHSFYFHNLDHSKLPVSYRDHINPSLFRWIKRLPTRDIFVGSLSNGRGFAWITKTSSIIHLLRSFPTYRPSDLIRNALGLEHIKGDDFIIELIYPSDALTNKKVCTPTFFEGSPSLIYKSICKSDGWGRSIDIVTIKESLPEAIHEEVSFNSDFGYVYYGRLSSPLQSFDWDSFHNMFAYKWSFNYIFRKLFSYAAKTNRF